MKVLITAIVVMVMSALFIKAWDGEGIVILPGYEHAVALCDGMGYPDEDLTIAGEAAIMRLSGITYVINKDHQDDPEIADLVSLASTHCQQYFNKQ